MKYVPGTSTFITGTVAALTYDFFLHILHFMTPGIGTVYFFSLVNIARFSGHPPDKYINKIKINKISFISSGIRPSDYVHTNE